MVGMDGPLKSVEVPRLADDVEAAMGEVLPSQDPLDATDFDVVDYINSKFPNERSIPLLEPFIKDVGLQISSLDDEISRAVHAQAEAGARASRDIGDARVAMGELQKKIELIRSKAEESEAIVRDICKDIKSLDTAKKNLQSTITALKRMHMLHSAIVQLHDASEGKRYGEAASLLEAVGHLLEYFEPYGDVPRIADMQADVAGIRRNLEAEVLAAFEHTSLLSETSTAAGVELSDFGTIKEACLVVDAIGGAPRERQIAAFVDRQLEPYGDLFPKGGDYSDLEHAERRFAWIRRVLKSLEQKYGDALPRHWYVERRLVLGFVAATRGMFLEILSSGTDESRSVTTVLKALQKSLVFEKEAQARFDERGRQVDEHAYESWPAGKAVAETAVAGALSGVFDPFMDPYVQLEKSNMDDMMVKVMAEEAVDRDGALPVLSSSVHMFAYVKTSVRRCTALTTGQTFFKLYGAFCECLRGYAARLSGLVEIEDAGKSPTAAKAETKGARLMREFRGARGSSPEPGAETDGAASGIIRDCEAACYALNTAEYCAETVGQLGDIVRGKIDAPYADRVDLEPVADAFHDVIAKAVTRLVASLERALEPALRGFSAIAWGAVEEVDEESPYVRLLANGVRSVVPLVRGLLGRLYFRNFCDKFVASFLPTFHDRVRGAKKISEMGTHQLLLDLHSVKPALLQLPNARKLPWQKSENRRRRL